MMFQARTELDFFLLAILVYFLVPFSANGQDVLVDVHIKPLSIEDTRVKTRVNYSDRETDRTQSSAAYNAGLTIGIGNIEKIIWVMDLNWIHEAYNTDTDWPDTSPDPDQFRTSSTNLGLDRMEIGFGADRYFTLHKKFLLSSGIRLIWTHQFNYRYERLSETADTLGTLTETRIDQWSYPKENTVGVEALGQFYYRVIPRLSIGLKLINRFGLTVASGEFVRENRLLDANGTEVDYFKQVNTGVDYRFAYNFSVSFGIQYQISKRKEKKKD